MVGASGAIGNALLTRLLADDSFSAAVGLSRSGYPALDLTSERSIAEAANYITHLSLPLRLVLDATGFLHDNIDMPEKSWRQLDPRHMARAFAVNAIGPAMLMKNFLPLLSRDGKSVFATLSARVGSINDNDLGG